MDFCQVLGLEIAVADMKGAVDWVCTGLDELRGKYITFANTHAVVMAHDSKKYYKVQNAASRVFADGNPIAVYERRKGFSKAERVAGPDFMTEIFQVSAKKGYRHYFYGSSEATLRKLEKRLKECYPGIEIAGVYSPPYESKIKKDYQQDVDRINRANADFIWIGLGAPKQELWMYQQKGKVNGVMLGVGAGFDFHAGVVKRAPEWMQKCGLEWFYRLLQEPGRLGKRYLNTNLRFIRLCMLESKNKKVNQTGK